MSHGSKPQFERERGRGDPQDVDGVRYQDSALVLPEMRRLTWRLWESRITARSCDFKALRGPGFIATLTPGSGGTPGCECWLLIDRGSVAHRACQVAVCRPWPMIWLSYWTSSG